MTSHGLPFIPQGFQTLGPQGQQELAAQGITLSVQHDPECRHSHTDITYTLDITAFQERSRRQGIFRILDSHLEGHGCLCGADPISTSALNEKIRNATAPPQATPFILRATQEWPEELASQDPATPTDRMDVHHGGLENSIHRADTDAPPRSPPRPNTETAYPPPPVVYPPPPPTIQLDTTEPSQYPVPSQMDPLSQPVPSSYHPTPLHAPQPRLPFHSQRQPTPILFAPPPHRQTETEHAARTQTTEDLLAHMNNVVAGINGNIATLIGRVSMIGASQDEGRKEFADYAEKSGRELLHNRDLHDRTNNVITDLLIRVIRMEEELQKQKTSPPANRTPIALPLKPANTVREKSRSRKGKERMDPSPTPAATPTPFSQTSEIPDAPPPHPNRAPPPPNPTRPKTPRPSRAAAQGPKNNVAPPPGADDPTPTSSSSSDGWAIVASRNKDRPMKDETRKGKKVLPKPASSPPHPTPRSTPKIERDHQLIVERPEAFRRDTVNRILIQSEINTKLTSMGVEKKAGLIKTVRTSRAGHIVLTTDDNHNANSIMAFKNTITSVLRPILNHPFDLVKDLERMKIKVMGVPLNMHYPRRQWDPSDWTEGKYEEARLQFMEANRGINAIDRPRVLGSMAALAARKEKSATFVFSVEKNDAAKEMVRTGFTTFAATRRTCTEWIRNPLTRVCPQCLDGYHLQGLCRNRARCKYCLGPHLTKDHECANPKCRVKGRACLEHDSKRCFTCDGTDHITGNRRCPALGTVEGG